ncbi:MAG: phospholipase [Chloroflexi bacterium]|nr:phospholipase [Chloroflexota bacterium]
MGSSSRNSGGRTVLAIILGLLLIAATFFLYGPQAALETISDLTGVELDLPAEQAPANQTPVEELTGGGSFYTVYFTNPVIPFDEVTTGGVEANLIPLINQATTSIDVAVFEFNLQSVADALIAAHERGVQVRVVHDNEHTEEDPQIDQLIEAGIPAVPDERSAFMHNKFLVIDSSIVWTGSMNLTENGAYRNNNNVIVLRSSRLAENYTTEFEEMFIQEAFGPTSPSNTPNPVVTIDGTRIENYFAPEDDVLSAINNVIASAEESVHFMAFAFTEDSIGQAMLEQLNAGVPVRGIFETRGAATEFSECNLLLQSGADVRLDDNPRTFHHKVIIVDRSIVVIGSFNFSANATESNDENLVIVYNPDVAGLYEQEFERQFSLSVEPGNTSECLRDDS